MKLSPTLSTSDIGVKIPYHTLHGEVEFKNVHFAYPTRKEHVSLTDVNNSIEYIPVAWWQAKEYIYIDVL